eukprot:scaffold96622_cov36-Cyclotella_meneghiniana.AAC.1
MSANEDSALERCLIAIPKKLETVKLAGMYIQAYPETDLSMPASKRLYALLCNKNAAAACFVPIAQLISFYAGRSNVDTKARVLMTQWQSRLTSNWADPASLRVISYHAADGSKIDTAMTGGVLKPIDDGTENSRRPEGVRFAQVELTLDYTDLHWNQEATTVRCTYFIDLPVGNVTFNNTAGTAVTRFTCNIAGDPFALSKDELREQVLTPNGINGPAKLMPADIGGGACKLDEEGKAKELQDRILQVANESIYHKLCEHVAPGHTSTLHSAVEKIKMSYVDESGNTVSLSVMEYYEALMRGAIPFAEMPLYPYNLAQHFVMCLSKSVKDLFDEEDKSYLALTDHSREAQQRHLELYLARAIKCEKKETAVKNVVMTTIGNTHSFYAKVFSALGLPEPDKDAVASGTYLSACEKTLAKYAAAKGDKDNATKRKFTEAELKQAIKCWGCGGPHPYRDRQSKEILCPNKDKPGVQEKADQKHKAYVEQVKKSKRGYVKRNKVTFSDLSAEEQVKARQHIATEATTIAQSAASHNNAGAISFAVVPVMQSSNHSPVLPLAIDGQLPHISLVLGRTSTPMEQCPVVRVMVDTGACCNTGYAKFWLPILKANPHIVQEVLTTDDGKYQPIILGGVVTGDSGDMSAHTTKLTLVVKIHLRYETIHHQPVTLSLAIGNNVGVNTIVGKTFIRSLQCIYDSLGGVLETRLLNVAPFPVTDMFPQHYSTEDKVSAPSVKKSYSARPFGQSYGAIVDKLTEFERVLEVMEGIHANGGKDFDLDVKPPAIDACANAGNQDQVAVSPTIGGGEDVSIHSTGDSTNDGFDTGIIPDSPSAANYGRARKRRMNRTRFIEPSPESTLRDDYGSDEE